MSIDMSDNLLKPSSSSSEQVFEEEKSEARWCSRMYSGFTLGRMYRHYSFHRRNGTVFSFFSSDFSSVFRRMLEDAIVLMESVASEHDQIIDE